MSRAALDSWLEQAERVLQEQAERSVSPSSDPSWAVEPLERAMPLSQLADDLEGVLRTLCEGPGRWVLIVEDAARPHHFWQALCFEDGSLHVEVVSNYYLAGDDRLTPEQEEMLRVGGWGGPLLPRSPNWSRTEFTTAPDTASIARQSVEALREVFLLQPQDLVFVKLFSSTLRGATPACPIYGLKEDQRQLSPPDDVLSPHEPDMTPEEGDLEWALDFMGLTIRSRDDFGPELIDPCGGPDGEDPDIFGPDAEVGPDELNGSWEEWN